MKSRTLRLEELGSRVLPSAAPWHPVPELGAALTPAHGHHAHGVGQGHGDYTTSAIHSGAGPEYDLTGKAHLRGIGHFHVSGSIHAVGFMVKGHAGGELTFSNARGTLTLELTGPEQPGFSPLPRHFHYKVVSGTGRYAELSGHGSLTLNLSQPTGQGDTLHGTFSLTVNSFAAC